MVLELPVIILSKRIKMEGTKMKSKKIDRKLVVNKETISDLNVKEELAKIKGGSMTCFETVCIMGMVCETMPWDDCIPPA